MTITGPRGGGLAASLAQIAGSGVLPSAAEMGRGEEPLPRYLPSRLPEPERAGPGAQALSLLLAGVASGLMSSLRPLQMAQQQIAQQGAALNETRRVNTMLRSEAEQERYRTAQAERRARLAAKARAPGVVAERVGALKEARERAQRAKQEVVYERRIARLNAEIDALRTRIAEEGSSGAIPKMTEEGKAHFRDGLTWISEVLEPMLKRRISQAVDPAGGPIDTEYTFIPLDETGALQVRRKVSWRDAADLKSDIYRFLDGINDPVAKGHLSKVFRARVYPLLDESDELLMDRRQMYEFGGPGGQ